MLCCMAWGGRKLYVHRAGMLSRRHHAAILAYHGKREGDLWVKLREGESASSTQAEALGACSRKQGGGRAMRVRRCFHHVARGCSRG